MLRIFITLSFIFLMGCTALANKFDMTYSGAVHDNDGKITEDLAVQIEDEAHSR